MESFGALLRQYIKLQGFTIYQIAKETGIDRSFLQGVLSEKRKLPQKRFSEIVNLSYFTPAQLSRLCNAYYIEKLGKDKIKRLQRIEYGILGKIKEELKTPILFDGTYSYETGFLNGRNEVLHAIHTALSKDEIKCFYSNFSFENQEINRIVYHACIRKRIFDFFHFVQKNDGSDCRNINIIFNSLHYAEAGYITHITNVPSTATNFMPYFIFTDSSLILYDEKSENGIIMPSKPVGQYMSNYISHIKCGAKQNVFISTDPFEAQTRIQNYAVSQSIHYARSLDNAVGSLFITPQIIEAIATKKVSNIPAVITRLQTHFDLILGKEDKCLKELCLTYEALENYVHTGRIPSFPPANASNVPHELRSQLLLNLLRYAENDGKLQITNPQTLPMTYSFVGQITNRTLTITTCEDLSLPMAHQEQNMYFTDEQITVEDFYNYYDYLSSSEKTFSPEISKSILQSFIKELEAK